MPMIHKNTHAHTLTHTYTQKKNICWYIHTQTPDPNNSAIHAAASAFFFRVCSQKKTVVISSLIYLGTGCMIRKKRPTKDSYTKVERTHQIHAILPQHSFVYSRLAKKKKERSEEKQVITQIPRQEGVREEGHLAFESVHDGVRDEEGVVNTCDCSVRQKKDKKLCVCCTNAFFFPNHTKTI